METAAVIATILAVVHTQPTNDVTGFSLLSGVYEKCSNHPDVYSCLKMRAVTLLDRALATDSLPVSEFLSITKDPKAKVAVSLRPTDGDLEATLPRDLGQKSSTLDKMIMDRLSQFLETRTVQLNMPADVFEGREKGLKIKKGGKGGGIYLLMFGAFGAMMMQLFMTKIALIAGKALLVGKVALLLAGVIGLKSLMSHGHEEKHASQIIYAEPEVHHGGGGGWSRSTHIPEAAHDLAYRGQRSLQH